MYCDQVQICPVGRRMRCGGMTGGLQQPIQADARFPLTDELDDEDNAAEPESRTSTRDQGSDSQGQQRPGSRDSFDADRASRDEHTSDAESTASQGR